MNQSISRKIFAIVATPIAALALMFFTGFGLIYTLSGLQNDGYSHATEAFEAGVLADSGSRLYRIIADSIINHDLEETQKLWNEEYARVLAQVNKAATWADSEEKAQSVEAGRAAVEELGAIYGEKLLPALRNSGEVTDEIRATDGQADVIISKIEDAFSSLTAEAFAQAELKDEQFDAYATYFLWALAAIGLVAAAGSGLFGRKIGREMLTALNQLAETVGLLAKEEYSITVSQTDRGDEIGAIARNVEVLRGGLLEGAQLRAEEGRRTEAERRRVAEQAEAAKALEYASASLAAGLKRLASGDLSFQLTDAFAPDFEPLRHDFNQSVQQLGEALAAISSSIAAMEGGTQEIASGAQDLSKRTEQQAASLEETAAALDQITANVTSSTQRTEDARNVATQANHSAVKSTEVVAHAEDAMKKIEESSQQISNIIGVIDEIAFQTNLLALNAGVEAARAGDAGKGFAVVAQEVRELAQRSAQAAREIKELIENSSSEVENGVRLVRGTGEALKTIGDFITQINTHMDSIATSAREQSVGLAEVNTAVNSMDQTTQQNAAMVEQSNAASNSLAQEAGSLRELVSRFQLGNLASSQSAALRQTARVMTAATKAPATARRSAPAVSGNTALAAKDWSEF